MGYSVDWVTYVFVAGDFAFLFFELDVELDVEVAVG